MGDAALLTVPAPLIDKLLDRLLNQLLDRLSRRRARFEQPGDLGVLQRDKNAFELGLLGGHRAGIVATRRTKHKRSAFSLYGSAF